MQPLAQARRTVLPPRWAPMTTEIRMVAQRQSPEFPPLPFGDHLDGAIDDLDGRLFVDGVGRDADVAGPPLCVSEAVPGESVQVREDREVDDSQGAIVPGGLPLDEGRTDP